MGKNKLRIFSTESFGIENDEVELRSLSVEPFGFENGEAELSDFFEISRERSELELRSLSMQLFDFENDVIEIRSARIDDTLGVTSRIPFSLTILYPLF